MMKDQLQELKATMNSTLDSLIQRATLLERERDDLLIVAMQLTKQRDDLLSICKTIMANPKARRGLTTEELNQLGQAIAKANK